MIIKVLGPGCPNCQKLENNVKQAVTELSLKDATVEHITDITEITNQGIMATPGIIINDQVRSTGRIPEVEEIKSWLENQD